MADKNHISFKTIAPFLHTGNRISRGFNYAGLAIGVILLLCCTQMYINIGRLLQDKSPRRNGFDFISVTKSVTNANMGRDNRFSDSEIANLKKQPFITDVAPMIDNQFRVKLSAGNIIPLSTDLFLESVKNDFIDTLPPSFSWHEGQADVPIIFSADFLEMYNVFAPAQGLPQVSASSIGAVNISLECYATDGSVKIFRGHIVGVSDRLNSVIVPETFLAWGNKTMAPTANAPAARIFIKTTDANSAALQRYIQQKDYHVNRDKTKFGRTKNILQTIVASLGGLAALVVMLSLLLFSFYLQLVLSRSRQNLQLLLTLGYSPIWLSGTVTKKWLPIYGLIILLALAATQLFQFIFQQNFTGGDELLSVFIHPVVALIAVLLFAACIFANYSLIKRALLRQVQ